MVVSAHKFLKATTTDGTVGGCATEKATCAIIGAPIADGQPIKGVEDGPDAIRAAGLAEMAELCGWRVKDFGNINFESKPAEERVSCNDAECSDGNGGEEVNVKNALAIGRATGKIFEATRRSAKEGYFTLTVGGDHSIAGGSIAGVLSRYPDLAVIWVDAHADCNTPQTSPSGNYHGMPAAHLMGWFEEERDGKVLKGFEWAKTCPKLPEDRLALIGLRDVDDSERSLLAKSKVNCFTMHHLDRMGVFQVITGALKAVDPEGVRPLHLSFDIDSCDPSIAPGTGTQARGGLTYREAHLIAEILHETGRLVSMDFVEVNPLLDAEVPDEELHGDRIKVSSSPTLSKLKNNKTARLAVELIGSALGTTIL